MGRIRKPNHLERISETIDPKRVFLLACEGRHTERKYFEGINLSKDILNIIDLIEIQIFKKSNQDLSNPLRIFEELKEWVRSEGLIPEEICLIVDRDSDSFTEGQYVEVMRKCNEERYSLYLNNPNFELWLLFHFLEGKFTEEEIKEIKENPKGLEILLQDTLREKGYSRSNKFNKKILFNHYIDGIGNAIENSKDYKYELEDLKENLGTNVFKLLELMIKE